MIGKTVKMPVERSGVRSTLAVAVSLNGHLVEAHLMIVNRKTVDTELIKFGYSQDQSGIREQRNIVHQQRDLQELDRAHPRPTF